MRAAAEALAPLVKAHDVVITHGNGPQVGFLALESASDPVLSHPYPFDTLVAETQGLIGNWLVGALEHAAPDQEVVCLLTDPGRRCGPFLLGTHKVRRPDL